LARASLLRYLVIPALAGLVATWAVYGVLARHSAAAPPTTRVVVAQRAVPAKTVLAARDVTLAPVPVALAAGAASQVAAVVGQVTVAPLAAGQIVYTNELVQPGNSAALSYHIPSDARAETVRVNDVTGVSGLIQPGDRVDVVAVFDKAVTGKGEAQLLLQDVLVLAVGASQQAGAAGTGVRGGSPPADVTLAVAPQQALLLAYAQARGSVQLLLRPAVADAAPVAVQVVTDQDLIRGAAARAAAGGAGSRWIPPRRCACWWWTTRSRCGTRSAPCWSWCRAARSWGRPATGRRPSSRPAGCTRTWC
jgi:pilus assembly protein CpaB